MRVTNVSLYRNYTSSVNDVHVRLNKSMNKISSGAAYETAADSPLSYYAGKKMDNQFQDAMSKASLIKDVQNRIYQQELGARDIHSLLAQAKKQVQYARTATTTGSGDIQTIRDDLLQKQQSMINDLNMQYEDFYIFGGNDVSTSPFSLSQQDDQMVMTYSHVFPGEDDVTEFKFVLQETSAKDGNYEFILAQTDANGDVEKDADGKAVSADAATWNKLIDAMSEQGRIDIGYGDISDRGTLLDTYTGGLNLLTGFNSDAVRASNDPKAEIQKRLNESPVALVGAAALAINEYIVTSDKPKLVDVLGNTIDSMTETEHTLSTVFSDLGNKYSLMDDTLDCLNSIGDALQDQYREKLGADPYESIMEMFNSQYSYNAALQVGSKLLGSTLFDFMG